MQTTFKRGYKFDLLDMFIMTPKEVQELFWKEFESKVDKKRPNLDNLKVMLEPGLVEVNAKNEYGNTPLHVAVDYNRLALAKLLISSGAEVNAKSNYGWTPLHRAVSRNHLALAKLLISSGADVNAKDEWGGTPLHSATYNNHLEVAKLLISSEAEVNAKNDSGETPLHWAARWNHLELAKLLFKHSSKKNIETVLNRYRNVCGHKRFVKSLEKLKV